MTKLAFLFSLLFVTASSGFANVDPSAPVMNQVSPAVWGDAHADWDLAIRQSIRENKSSFEQADDIETFCPGYKTSSNGRQENCLLRLVSAVVMHENETFDPADTYEEPGGALSVGLLMLSKNECPNAMTDGELKNPIENLKCGVKKMAALIKAADCISCRTGAGKYWSTLRAAYTHTYTNRSGSHTLNLGKKTEIANLTRKYAQFSTSGSAGAASTFTAAVKPAAITTPVMSAASVKVAETVPAIAPPVPVAPIVRPAAYSPFSNNTFINSTAPETAQ